MLTDSQIKDDDVAADRQRDEDPMEGSRGVVLADRT